MYFNIFLRAKQPLGLGLVKLNEVSSSHDFYLSSLIEPKSNSSKLTHKNCSLANMSLTQ